MESSAAEGDSQALLSTCLKGCGAPLDFKIRLLHFLPFRMETPIPGLLYLFYCCILEVDDFSSQRPNMERGSSPICAGTVHIPCLAFTWFRWLR